MTQIINLNELERKAFKSTFQDGLWDLYLGLLLLVMGIGPLLYNVGIPVLWNLVILAALAMLILAAFWTAKKFITVPRMGRVKFGPKSQARKKKAAIVFAISVLAGIVLFVVALALFNASSQRQNPELIMLIIPAAGALTVILVFGLGAYYLGFDRLYLIGVLYALPLPLLILVDKLTGIDLGFIATAGPAAAILLVGTVIFIRFLRDYPIPAAEEFDGNRA